MDKPREECGVVGLYGHSEAAKLAYLALYALQHRGQESAGIASSDCEKVYRHVGMGLVADVFSDPPAMDRLRGSLAIGHNRYSTTGGAHLLNAQPMVVKSKDGALAIAHNGNFINSRALRERLEDEGSIFQTTSDTEIVLHLIARSRKKHLVDKLKDALSQVRGAYSIVMLTQDRVIAVRDPRGWRPMCLGRKDDALVIASESCAFDIIGAELVRDVEPGEIVVLDANGISSHRLDEQAPRAACIFELIYFSRPDSRVFEQNVDKARRKLGKNLALESPAEADIVISVPDSSNTAALGFARRTDIKFELGLIRNHYIGRTFIHPEQSVRDFNVRVKYNPVRGVLKERRVVIVEDSIVRGTTLRQLVKMVRRAGAKEVHVRVSCPPIRYPCYYGIDFPDPDELVANRMSIEELREHLDVDSLKYLSLHGLLESVAKDGEGYCTACFDGQYPLQVEEDFRKDRLEVPVELSVAEQDSGR